MNRREFIAATAASLFAAAPPSRPNIVLILVDDLGATDLACYGSKFYRTPNMDRLAAEGVRFTQAYSACTVCSPSRAAVLTGKYPARLHLTDWIAGHSYPWAKLKPPPWTMHLPADEVTIAERLKPLGYATASIGKWHLTTPDGDPALFPDKQGFDVNRGGTGRGQPPSYFAPYKIPTLQEGPDGEYLTDREADEACRFIEAQRGNPFFLYLPFHTVHTPLQAKADKIARYKQLTEPSAPQRNPVYAAMIESLDEAVGRILDTLQVTGAATNTLVLLTGDNGALLQSTNTNLGMRAGKGSAYEGGVRVPLLVQWPRVTRAGSTCSTPVIGCDLAATVLDAVGLRDLRGLDGVSLRPLLQGRSLRRDAIFWHYPHYHPGGATPYSAVRSGRHKLIRFAEHSREELYDLESDPEEKQDLAQSNVRVKRQLAQKLDRWLQHTGAQRPEPNPKYDPERAGLTAAQAKARGLLDR